MGDPLKKAVEMLDRQLYINNGLRVTNGSLLREIRSLKKQTQGMVKMHPSLKSVNDKLIGLEKELSVAVTDLRIVEGDREKLHKTDDGSFLSLLKKLCNN